MGPKKGLEYGVTTTTTAVTMEIVLNGGVMVVVTVEVTQAGFHVAPSHEGAVEPAMTSVLRSIARAGVRSPEVPFRKQTPIKANVHVRREMVTKARMRVLIAMGGAILAGTIQNNHNGNGAGEASEARAIRPGTPAPSRGQVERYDQTEEIELQTVRTETHYVPGPEDLPMSLPRVSGQQDRIRRTNTGGRGFESDNVDDLRPRPS
ncbi:hypothetical protein LTR09_000969 [Extremus antarcticus]|uniref:Uncharacterized protein n=1 Tax=Extremus antarcticus TaxID=702011 RepID=A0AAJ0GHY1_9PEZI|nr:hypothetical protein LTR09_000969 [Extremus antarcticus]